MATQQVPDALIAFASQVAAQHCELTAFNRSSRVENGEDADDWSNCFVSSDVGFGLRQSFESEGFELAHLDAFSALYRTMVNAIAPVYGLAAGEPARRSYSVAVSHG